MDEIKIRTLTASEIECRVGQCGKSGDRAWCSLLLYKDARCDQRILDEVFGMFGWVRQHEVINGNLCCTVSIKNPETGEWVSKQDVGVESNTEAVKGNFSDAFKRACFNWGIGRELYTAPKIFVWLNNNEWSDYQGKAKMSPKCVFIVTEIAYDENRNINRLVIVDKDGVVRYTFGQAESKKIEKVAENEQQNDFADNMNGYILPALEQANDEASVKRVWDDYPNYQNVPEFVAAVTERLSKVKKVA